MLHSFTSFGSRREGLLQRGGSCTAADADRIGHYITLFVNSSMWAGTWNVHHASKRVLLPSQFGMPWNKNIWLEIEGSINSRLALNRDMPQPQPAIISSHSHVYSLVNIPPNHSKAYVQAHQYHGGNGVVLELETNQSTIGPFIMVYRLLLLGFPWNAEQWVRPPSLKVDMCKKTLHKNQVWSATLPYLQVRFYTSSSNPAISKILHSLRLSPF